MIPNHEVSDSAQHNDPANDLGSRTVPRLYAGSDMHVRRSTAGARIYCFQPLSSLNIRIMHDENWWNTTLIKGFYTAVIIRKN